MPLTQFQTEVLALLAPQRSGASYLAGGAALHIGVDGERFSDDLDFFHNSADAASWRFLPLVRSRMAVSCCTPSISP